MEIVEVTFSRYIKPYVKPFLIVLAIYVIAMLSIWRSGVSYVDDMRRAVHGNAWGSGIFSRYSLSLILYILNVDAFALTDISPIPQIVAMMFLSISGVMATYLFCDGKIKYIPLILSAFIGLSPFNIECWLYKFDAPGFAMCILASIIPMLFWRLLQKENAKKHLIAFFIVATACLLVMWSSYQAGSGIYLVMVAGLAFRDFLEKRKLKVIFKTVGLFAIPYIAAALVFRYALPNPTGYIETEMLAFSDMLPGLWRNTITYIRFLLDSPRAEWIALTSLMLICFVVSLLFFSKREKYGKLIDAAVGVGFVCICVPISHGAYLLLQNPVVNTRSSLGIGLILAIVGIVTCRGIADTEKEKYVENDDTLSISGKTGLLRYARNDGGATVLLLKKSNFFSYLLALSSLVLLYSFAVFSLALGNALADQERWGDFRTQILLTDFSNLYPDYGGTEKFSVQVNGEIGLSAVAAHVNKNYPITEHIINYQQHGLGGTGGWSLYKLQDYYNWDQNFSGLWEDDEWDYSSWEIMLDTYYHTIRDSGDGRVHVVVK